MVHHTNDDPTPGLGADSERMRILRSLARDLAHCEPPSVFGLHGDWGAGKTSFLWRLYLELSGEGHCPPCRRIEKFKAEEKWTRDREIEKFHLRVLPIWFEAWRYQAEPVPVVALLHEIRRQVEADAGPFGGLKSKAKKLAWLGRHAAGQMLEKTGAKISLEAPKLLSAVAPTAKIEVSTGLPSLRAAGEAYDAGHYAGRLTTDALREELEKSIDLLMPDDKTEGRRLVIFVDDLDRCDPEAAWRLLEGIKVYLSLKNCVFLLGINQREVERAIAKFIPATNREANDEDALLIRSQEYIEKLCGQMIRLPRLPCSEQVALVKSQLADDSLKPICAALVVLLENAPFLPANPRRVKAWCSTVRRLLELRTERHARLAAKLKAAPKKIGDSADPIQDMLEAFRSSETDARALAIAASLYTFHPQLHSLAEANPDFLEILGEAAESPPQPFGDGRWPADVHPALMRIRFPNDGALGTVATGRHEDPSSIGVLHCRPLFLASKFGSRKLTPNDFLPYLAL